MFENIHIDHFRGIKSCQIDGLEQVNLFFGKNNCGKSSVLEGLFLLSGQSNPSLPITINNMRSYFRFSEMYFGIDFYNLNTAIPIVISTGGAMKRTLKISLIQSKGNEVSLNSLVNETSSVATKYYGLTLQYTLGDDGNTIYKSEIILKEGEEGKGKTNIDKRYHEHVFSQYFPSNSMGISVQTKFAKVVENKQENNILKALQVIEPKILDIQLVGNELMVDIGLPQRLPINVMGDGIRKLLSIILSIYESKDGILLIDEVDNGFHYSAMKPLWKAVLHAAKEYNTQVFVSTHNIDSLKGLVAVLDENDNYRPIVSAFKLIKHPTDEVKALKYGYEEMAYAIAQEMEMR